MSESNAAMRHSRGKVWLHLVAGNAVGRPLAEWGYRTPRFPHGIKGSDLAEATLEIRRETMIVWFLANHIPAKGPYFGFAEAASLRPGGVFDVDALDHFVLDGGIEIAGFDQGSWSDGGMAGSLLKAEFGNIVDEQLLTNVAGLFHGLWEMLPPDPFVDLENQTPAERSATIASALDVLAEAVRKITLPHGGIGHNGPPDDSSTITEDDQRIVITACADARLAILSSDYSAASVAWQAAKPVFDKIASGITRHIDAYCGKFAATFGVTTALMMTGYLGCLLGLWNKGQAITAMLDLAKHLLH